MKDGFTLIELLIVVAIIAVLSGALFLIINPPKLMEKSWAGQAKQSLAEVAKAANIYALESGSYPADVNRDIPSEIKKYLPGDNWPKGPFPGSVYDWDNWSGQTCWDGSTGIIQVTLRQIDSYQGKTDYTLYYVMQGPGIPHCSQPETKGECINCPSRYP